MSGGAPWTGGPPPAARALPASLREWPADASENFEERSALIEHLGGLPRAEAERLAEERVRLAAFRQGCARPREGPQGGSP